MDKPQVGIASVWYEGNSCNMHLNDLAAEVRKGVTAADCIGMRFNTIGVSDGISMGTDGMGYSLQSRDLIADSIETVMSAQWYDALVTIPGCDKNMPGCVMAMGRLNRPAIMVYGGTIKPGCATNHREEEIQARHRQRLPVLRPVAGRHASPRRSASTIVESSCPGRRGVRRDVHRQHDGERDRVHGPEPAVLVLHPGRATRTR